MVFRFVLFSDEVDGFYREIKIDADATFFDLHNAILDSVGYEKNQITSFFLCTDQWERVQEITLFEMDSSSEYDNLVMDQVELRDMITEEKQRLQYLFDNVADRAFFIELREILLGTTQEKPACTMSKGKAPVQLKSIDDFVPTASADFVDQDFYGDEAYNDDELDDAGYEDMTFDESNY